MKSISTPVRCIGNRLPRSEGPRMLGGVDRFTHDLPARHSSHTHFMRTLKTAFDHTKAGAKGRGEAGTIRAPATALFALNDSLSNSQTPKLQHVPVAPAELMSLLRAPTQEDP